MSSSPAPRLGIDFGRVIVGGNAGDDTPFVGVSVAECLKCPPIEGAFDAIAKLCFRFSGRVWIVSKAGGTMQRKTLTWLQHNDFWAKTGIEPWSIAFVLERDQKVQVCKRLKLSHFIDDRLDVLEPMRKTMSGLFVFGPDPVSMYDLGLKWATRVETWADVLEKVHP